MQRLVYEKKRLADANKEIEKRSAENQDIKNISYMM